jgi:hypothetical protein
MPSYSSTPLTRVINAPVLVVSGVGSRLMITLKSNTNTIDSTIVAGDVIRYDAVEKKYVKSQADTPEHAEVIGIVESISTEAGGVLSYNVVTLGSLIYPASRLFGITGSGTQDTSDGGGYDVLFLDSGISGGLTGIAPSRGIAKVVAQVAPHGSYNTTVINYIGYQIGDQATVNVAGAMPGSVGTVPESFSFTDTNMIDASADQILKIDDYSELYDVIGGDQGPYWETVTLTDTSVVTVNWNTMVNDGRKLFQIINGVRTGEATIKAVDQTSLTITVEKQQSQSLYDSSKALYITGTPTNNLVYISTSEKTHFTVPAVESAELTVGDKGVKPYIVAKPTNTAYIPKALTIDSLTVKGSEFTVNDRDVLSELDALKTLVNQINQFYNL